MYMTLQRFKRGSGDFLLLSGFIDLRARSGHLATKSSLKARCAGPSYSPFSPKISRWLGVHREWSTGCPVVFILRCGIVQVPERRPAEPVLRESNTPMQQHRRRNCGVPVEPFSVVAVSGSSSRPLGSSRSSHSGRGWVAPALMKIA